MKPHGDGPVVVLIHGTKRQREARALATRTATRRQQAVALRMSGATYQAIGDSLGITKKAAWVHVQRGLAEIQGQVREQAEMFREQELLRLDRMQVGLWTAATSGNVKAVLAVLRIIERRSRLLGLDAPAR